MSWSASDAAHLQGVLSLQRRVGNQAVSRLLAPSDEHDEAEIGKEGGEISAALAARIGEQRGGGEPLEASARASMESTFDADFSDVRIHSGDVISRLSRRLGAAAFTSGSDIFVGSGGDHLDRPTLAHELVHVLQQRDADSQGPLTVTAADDSQEREAEGAAVLIASTAAGRQPC